MTKYNSAQNFPFYLQDFKTEKESENLGILQATIEAQQKQIDELKKLVEGLMKK